MLTIKRHCIFEWWWYILQSKPYWAWGFDKGWWVSFYLVKQWWLLKDSENSMVRAKNTW